MSQNILAFLKPKASRETRRYKGSRAVVDHFSHAQLDAQSRAWLRDARGDVWVVSFNTEFGPEVTAVERGVPESHMTPVRVTDEMVDRALVAFFSPFYKDNMGDKVAMKIALEAALTK